MSEDERRFSTVVLTGATSGIGEATAHRLSSPADRLVLLGPEPEPEVAAVLRGIRNTGSADVRYVPADFTSLADVVGAAQAVRALAPRIDVLINDAGVPGAPERSVTTDGFERTLQVNALAPALLTRLLVPALGPHARIVNVGSSAHHIERFDFADIDLAQGYTPVAAYGRAKLAMVTWSSLLAEEEAGTDVTVVALCPGLNDTPLSAAMMGRIGGPPSVGAARVLHAITADVPSGSYLENDRVVAPSAEVRDPENRERLARLYWTRLAPFARSGARA
ncbi:SDR family NAD(P)-dependent oxidoreductase [Herbiconiux ginsengi]|uniref:NAD(P)-dependent dehydrogenase, short-chain alcohol dehydrogenase family n=1 Tax=Herbiconiux ginsengi TaxID=381665 RepID=A0A1H3LJ82_9MICO|nr:SDR family NAD(P)-dependent oxidoreductase [Herbiconiux ginsengi]SDY64532.1 NAD(P)-dependent dehydrogenase, short-chain alcohol dehydrogenase family [Herbiconiux ginsengi]